MKAVEHISECLFFPSFPLIGVDCREQSCSPGNLNSLAPVSVQACSPSGDD